jgi:type I restriction-modification system DNA methylase subunit
MNIDYVKKLIVELGFAPQDGTSDVFVKRYTSHDNYPIFVDFSEQRIEYAHQSIKQDKCIRLGDLTTSSLKGEKSEKLENLVVLECVDRLLKKGYRPERLELEKKYPLGRNMKGKLDILVYSEDDSAPFLMIECKTWGSEFDKEATKTLKDGGQIFSYYQQDRAARFLCLYASRFDRKRIEYRNNIILVEESWRDLSSAKDIHDYWNKNFKDNGIFEVHATPYDIKPKALTYGMLKNLKEEDSGKIYNQIMEILRHNAISDKPNAFNKLLNLFVCKIIDENKNLSDELEFQWLETDTDESLQMRLNDLYKEGMWRFLEIRVIDHSEEDVSQALEGIDNAIQKQRLMDMFRDARLKKSPNFAFVEVLDEKTFKLNAKIVREVVELLQVYKFRYEQKHEFLGNFFELLLNTSMKQEAGQFFTPVPITRFIISSLPLKEFVQRKIDSRERNVLPVVMDYACGSGHFLTEYMDQMQTVIDKEVDVSAALPTVRNMVQSWQGLTKFLWAKDTVYGIDLDNRLVKTTKVSAFFNGDGEANIIWANGLDNFEKTVEYRDILRQTQPYDRKNNGQFDILISNPPYSVEAFKSTLKYGEDTFELYNHITDNSSEIECLFVERMKQLLKVGGWAGVILPSSILSNGGIHSKAREILFKYFKVKAIVELGSGTFMKTGTNTVALFLERRSDNDFVAIEKAINAFVSNLKDVTVLGVENAFSEYVANVYNDLTFGDYVSFIGGEASITMQQHELYIDCEKTYGRNVYLYLIAQEKSKIMDFLTECLRNSENFNEVKPADITKIKTYVDNYINGNMDFLPQDFINSMSAFVDAEYSSIDVKDYESFLMGNANQRVRAHDLFKKYVSGVCEHGILLEKEKMLYFLLTYSQNIVLVKTGQKQEEKNFLGYEFSERRGHEGIKQLSGGTKLFDETGDLLNPQKANSYIYNAFLGKEVSVDESLSRNVSYGHMSGFINYGTSKFDRIVNLNKKRLYTGQWNTDKIENLTGTIIGATTTISQKDILDRGAIPVIAQDSETLIAGYCDNDKPINDVPIILMGDHTCIFKWIDMPFVRGADNTQLIKFEDSRIVPKFGYYYLKNAKIYNQDKYERHFKYVKEMRIPLPPLDMQQKIVSEFERMEQEESRIIEQVITLKDAISAVMKNSIAEEQKLEKLGAIAQYSQKRVSCIELSGDTYVGVDNLLQNMAGKVSSQFVPASGTATAYSKGNILLSNIRPYLKKIWLADNDGGSSGDVLVLTVDNSRILSEYLYYLLAMDEFFEYEMKYVKGVKMPRADKTSVLNYNVTIPSLYKQQEVVAEIKKIESGISLHKFHLEELKIQMSEVLNKYL